MKEGQFEAVIGKRLRECVFREEEGLAGTLIFQLKSVKGSMTTATGTCIDHL